jgi:hypothetical protein
MAVSFSRRGQDLPGQHGVVVVENRPVSASTKALY